MQTTVLQVIMLIDEEVERHAKSKNHEDIEVFEGNSMGAQEPEVGDESDQLKSVKLSINSVV